MLVILCFMHTDKFFRRASTSPTELKQDLSWVTATPLLRSHPHLTLSYIHNVQMNFYFEATKILDRLDAKQGSIKGLIATLPEKSRKRSAALVIETLKCKASFVHLPLEATSPT